MIAIIEIQFEQGKMVKRAISIIQRNTVLITAFAEDLSLHKHRVIEYKHL